MVRSASPFTEIGAAILGSSRQNALWQFEVELTYKHQRPSLGSFVPPMFRTLNRRSRLAMKNCDSTTANLCADGTHELEIISSQITETIH